jgi:hypothetical protein
MVEVNSIPEEAQAPVAQIDTADLVVGVFVDLDQEGIASLWEGLRALPRSPRIVVLQSVSAAHPVAPAAETAEVTPSSSSSPQLSLLPWPVLVPDPGGTPQPSIATACQSLFEVSAKLQARGCCLIASKVEGVAPGWAAQLAQPLLEDDCDLVLPYFPLRKLQGLLNSSILYPLMRCLYGKRIHNPLGPDIGVSQQLCKKILAAKRDIRPGQNPIHPLASLAPTALCDNMKICQVNVGFRYYPPVDWTNTSSLLSQVLGPIFLNMEKNAACWQRTRGSVPVPTREKSIALSDEPEPLDINRMVETFKLGVRDLQEIWGLVLPPATLFQLRTMSRLPPEHVDMPDELWARIVFDFALAHRLRTINRDHLLRSMTPLYLAWVASYARKQDTARTPTVEQRIERLALAFETAKPYLVSRWRWPDRFNP